MAEEVSQVIPRTSVTQNLTKAKTDPIKAQIESLRNLEGDALLGLASRTGTRDTLMGYKLRAGEGKKYFNLDEFSRAQAEGDLRATEDYGVYGGPSRNGNPYGTLEQIFTKQSYTLSQDEWQQAAEAERAKQLADLESKLVNPEQLFTGTEAELVKGARLAEGILGPEGLGRLGDDQQVMEALQGYKNIADQGLSRQEVEAERTAAIQGIDRSTQTSQRSLQAALARSGVKGSLAGQQLLQAELGGMQQKANVERDLFLKSEEMKRTGLADYSSRLGEIKTFDIEQAAAEKDISLQTGLAFAQMQSATDIAKIQGEAAANAAAARAQASSCFPAGTKVRMYSGHLKNIEDIELGDVLSTGMVSGITRHLAKKSELVEVEGNLMTDNHIILHDNEYVMAGTISKKKYPEILTSVQVFDLIVEGSHRIELENGLVAMDFEGIEWDSGCLADSLNQIEKRGVYGKLSTKVSAGEVC